MKPGKDILLVCPNHPFLLEILPAVVPGHLTQVGQSGNLSMVFKQHLTESLLQVMGEARGSQVRVGRPHQWVSDPVGQQLWGIHNSSVLPLWHQDPIFSYVKYSYIPPSKFECQSLTSKRLLAEPMNQIKW